MTGSSVSIVRIFCTLVVIALCAGCASNQLNRRHAQFGYEDHVDLTSPSSSGVANIRGINRNLIGLLGHYCWVKSPGNAKQVTVDAGPVDIVAVCVLSDSVTQEIATYNAAFHFDALAGHDYEIGGRCPSCIRLRDATTDEVVAESPSHFISRDNTSSGLRRKRIPKPEEMITIDPSEEVVVEEAYVRFYKCPDPYVMVEGKTFLGLSFTLTCEEPSSSNDE